MSWLGDSVSWVADQTIGRIPFVGDTITNGIGSGVQWVVDNGLYNTEKSILSGENLLNLGFLGVSGVVGAFTGGVGGAAMIGGRIALGAGAKAAVKGGLLMGAPVAKRGLSALGTKLFSRGGAGIGLKAGAEGAEALTKRQVQKQLNREAARAFKTTKDGTFVGGKGRFTSSMEGRMEARVAELTKDIPGLTDLDRSAMVARAMGQAEKGGFLRNNWVKAGVVAPLALGARGSVMDAAGTALGDKPPAGETITDHATGRTVTDPTAETRPTTGLPSLFNIPAGAVGWVDRLDGQENGGIISKDVARIIVGLATFALVQQGTTLAGLGQAPMGGLLTILSGAAAAFMAVGPNISDMRMPTMRDVTGMLPT